MLPGGVLAHEGVISLRAAIAAAVLGAIIGDSIGYLVGGRSGRRMLHGTLGRLPIIKRRPDEHLDDAQAFVRRRKGSSVFFGRFTTISTVLVPGLAGMAEIHYSTFLAYNVAGGAQRHGVRVAGATRRRELPPCRDVRDGCGSGPAGGGRGGVGGLSSRAPTSEGDQAP